VSHATIGGFGYFRLGTDYESPESFDQEIKFRRVQNPFSVYMDPFSMEPDGSDQRFCFITELLNKEEFKRSYPDADTANFDTLTVGSGDSAIIWISEDSVRIAEYYKIKSTADTLVRLQDGRDVFKSDMQPGDLPMLGDDGLPKERASEKNKVCWYKITGREILEETEIPCKWIPVFPVYGDEQIVDGKIQRNGMVRFARDPQRMYNFWMTSATEEVSLRPKAPYIGAVGQFETAKKDWKQANVKSLPFLEYDPITVDGTMAPAPQRQQMADVPTGVLAMAMHASDNIKATTGIFDASLGAQGNETSGRAITARQREGDTANFHFADNLARTIRHAGRCIVNMLPKVYDTPRIVRVLGEDDKMDMRQVNAPLPPEKQEYDEQRQAIKTVENDLTVGKYDVTIGVGPSYNTKRAEFVDAAMQLGQSAPQIWQAAGDLIVRGMDWPKAEEIADRIKRTIPPQILGPDGEEGQQQQLPPQVIAALQQASTEIQQLQEALQKSESGMAVKTLEGQIKAHLADIQQQTAVQVAQINAESRQDVAELTGMVQLLLQKMQPPPQLAGAVAEDLSQDEQQEDPQGASPVSGA
jgi:hypothetical protein